MTERTDAELKTQITNNTRNRTEANKIVLSEQADIQEDIVDSKLNKADLPTIPSTAGLLNQNQVDARVRAGTLAPAQAGNTDRWDPSKLPANVAYGTIPDLTPYRTEAQINQLIDTRIPNNRRMTAGGTDGQVLAKSADADFNTEWITIIGLPAGGTNGQLLERTATGYRWIDKPGGTIPTPTPSDDVYLVIDPTTTFPGVSGATGLHFNNQGILSTTYPTIVNNSYVYFAQPQADNDINMWIVSNANQFGTIQKLADTPTINGVVYEVWRTNNRLLPAASGFAVEIRRPV